MANPMKGEADVCLADGRELRLAFNANAWIAAEDKLGGRPTPEIIAELQGERCSLKTQRALMWAGLQKYHPEISIEDAGEILIEAAEAMSNALTAGSPQEEGSAPAEGDADPPKKRGAGTRS